nr:PREDICTED: uncharacterized protein LOC103315098 isoform X1 [Tribolium castaneum]|eukprot:XP_015840272.1 PREDICTED: uncharacterized protein LOC103315098 isoform X1 [Tribolium castaneum]
MKCIILVLEDIERGVYLILRLVFNMSYDSKYSGYEFGATAFVSLALIAMFTLLLILFEVVQRKQQRLLKEGYYFVEEYVTIRRTRLIPVPPSNIDASDPNHPRVINPALLDRTGCICCA